MSFTDVLALIGGLSLFLLGMNSMGDGLEKACGSKMKMILEKLTSNRFIGVLVGMGVTMVIQSSSATTVMVVGFVNAGMMTLTQAVWVIMGANIGTTITGQLVALDVGAIAPFAAIIGVVMMLFIKKPKVNQIGMILSGFGVLFIGMDMMSGSMTNLKNNADFVNLMTSFENPLLGILVGCLFTAVIQSSSASIGILQGLAMGGVIGLKQSVYVLFGQNIGTCVTALLSSLSANRNAKRTTLFHFMFNIIGTIVFTIICITTDLEGLIINFTPNNAAQQIANMHTLFNISTTLLLLPFGTYLAKFTEKILPDKVVKKNSIFLYLNNDVNASVGGSAIHIENTKLEVERMYKLAIENIDSSFDCLLDKMYIDKVKITETEDLIDKLNEGIIREITHCLSLESTKETGKTYSAYLNISANIERLSDHAMNLYEAAIEFSSKNITLNDEIKEEIIQMKKICGQMLSTAFLGDYKESEILEDKIDLLTNEYRANMMERLKKTVCTAEGSIVYSSVLIDFERIGDHLLNIAEDCIKIEY